MMRVQNQALKSGITQEFIERLKYGAFSIKEVALSATNKFSSQNHKILFSFSIH